VSVTALDLSVQADGQGLKSAFDALVQENVLSGKPVVVVSPSASGKSIVSMVSSSSSSSSQSKTNQSLLKDVVKVWMPVASSAVLKVKKDDEFKIFTKLNIPILAMNGDRDEMGQRVTKKLVDVANAKGVSMKGGHPCYLDSPIVFVDVILSFLHELQKQ
jgi:pimeloyl-ACP methyl ester carboxylesterase